MALYLILPTAIVLYFCCPLEAATVTVIDNSASMPVFVTSKNESIELGTRIRVGTFLDISLLNNTITSYKAGSSYDSAIQELNNNFIDLGTGNSFGNVVQSAFGGSTFNPNSFEFQFNGLKTYTINAEFKTSTVFAGSIQNVDFAASLGFGTPLYIWIAFDKEIAIVRSFDTISWNTPTSNLQNITLTTYNLQDSAGSSIQTNEILLGNSTDFPFGVDLIQLSPNSTVPEPSAFSILAVGLGGLAMLRRRRS